jgi:uncharacterized protein HemX
MANFLAQIEEVTNAATEAIQRANSGEILVAVLVILAGSIWVGIYVWKVAIPNSHSLNKAIEAMAKSLDQQERIRSLESTQSTVLFECIAKNQQCLTEFSNEVKGFRDEVQGVKKVVENNTAVVTLLTDKKGANPANRR